jgi:hypothetical protein
MERKTPKRERNKTKIILKTILNTTLIQKEILQMKYYSDITNQLYETREQLFKAERDYKMELIAKARADEKAKKIADLEAQLAELKGETAAKTTTAPNTDTDGDNIDIHKTAEAIKKMIDKFKFKYPSFEFPDAEDDKDEKTAPAKTNGSCGDCSKCVKPDIDGDKKRGKLADSGYYSSAYVNLNGKEFYSEGADSWNDVKKAVREYFEKLQGLK